MQWFYSKNGTQLGPVAEAELRAKVSSGEVAPNDLVWREGMPDWQPASQAFGAASVAPSASTAVETETAPSSSPYAAPAASATEYPLQRIPNYLWQSILVTILCCWPLGIPAIVYAAKVDGLAAKGDIPGAMAASANAKKWSIIALVSGIVVLVIYAVIMATGVAYGGLQSNP